MLTFALLDKSLLSLTFETVVSSADPLPFPLSGIHRPRPKATVPVIPYKSGAGQVEAREFLSLSPQPEEIREHREIWNT